MLTVKYCFPDGDEMIFPVAGVTKKMRKVGSPTSPSADVTFDRLPGSGPGLLQVASGCVYVMNDNGKTVAKYDLGPYGDIPPPNTYSGAVISDNVGATFSALEASVNLGTPL